MSEKIELGPKEAISFLESQVNQAIYDLEENLLPNLGHGEKHRLISAMIRYPTLEADFSNDSEYLIKAYSAVKVCLDTNIALGLELFNQPTEEENNG
jgi:hypothetical protein